MSLSGCGDLVSFSSVPERKFPEKETQMKQMLSFKLYDQKSQLLCLSKKNCPQDFWVGFSFILASNCFGAIYLVFKY